MEIYRTAPALTIPHAAHSNGKKLFFGQLLVETPIPARTFANEAAGALVIQAELNGKRIDYAPQKRGLPDQVAGEYPLAFKGEIAGYLKAAPEAEKFFHVSFRIAEEGDKCEAIRKQALLVPDYVLTLSLAARKPGELKDAGFWGQLGICLFTGISTVSPYLEPKVAYVFGKGARYKFVPMGRE
jgi:hypothetical protein